jgi:hypothetical protein
VGVPVRTLDVQEAFGTGSTSLVDDDKRLRHQVVLLDHALKHSGHLVRPAARSGRNDKLDGFGRRPRRGRGGGQPAKRKAGQEDDFGKRMDVDRFHGALPAVRSAGGFVVRP